VGYSVLNIDEVEAGGRFDPETVRVPVSGSAGLSFIAIGARRGSYDARGPF
jgi:hypothetical protein